jgi:hypothetical protein
MTEVRRILDNRTQSLVTQVRSVCDSTTLKNKRIAPMGSNGLFLTCDKNKED